MNRTENDLRDALHDLDRRAVEHGAPSTASIVAHATDDRLGRHRVSTTSRLPRWLPPLAAAAVVAAAAVTVAVIGNDGPSDAPAAGPPSVHTSARPTVTPSVHTSRTPSASPATGILQEAAAKLDAAPAWKTPDPHDFFYVRTTEVTTWTSVSGTKPGEGRTTDGSKVPVAACRHGHIVADGESGPCTLDDVPHYLADAPTTPAAWDAYLEQIAPGAKAAGAQGKITVQVLHQDLTAPKAAAALLRYTATQPGLHTLAVRSVDGEKLIGVTHPSMSAGSYGLAFDARTHAFVGFVGTTQDGTQSSPAEIVRKTGIVPAVGRTP